MLWLTLLASLLSVFFNWLLLKQRQGGLSPAEKTRVGQVLTKMSKARTLADEMGVVPQPIDLEAGDWVPDAVYRVIVKNVILPKIRARLPAPLIGAINNYEDEWAAFITELLKE